MRLSRLLRRRGATFTVIVLLSIALLLSIGGSFVDASRNLVTLEGIRERSEQARDALAGAAEWSRAAAAAGQPSGTSTLKLSKVSVDVKLEAGDGAYSMDATAKTIDGTRRAHASLVKRDGRWVISRFELLEGGNAPKPEKKFR
jgi:hypothetical protein